ncbi:hypothetical protein OHI65_06910 [Brucella sp. MAB-22]|uniref:hypothetical protein n=1 Tax=Brucella sp. MAB-22 TaxID=2986424 RepID=UPI00221E5C34|nr:hypothetical protein [Brucella sp. MAB-22]UYT54103.1 hypothetical protein OHI65_06910 [Brucella sp. MAB-22]
MKLDREWRLVWKPMNEIMDSVTVKAGVRLNASLKDRVDWLVSKAEINPEMELQYFEDSRAALRERE